MGLDIYLYRYDDINKTQELQTKYQEYSDKLWGEVGEYDTLSQQTKDEIRTKCKEYAESLGLDEWGDCLLYTSPSPRDRQKSRMPSSA